MFTIILDMSFCLSFKSCSNCNKLIIEIKDFNVGILKIKYPYCGYQKL